MSYLLNKGISTNKGILIIIIILIILAIGVILFYKHGQEPKEITEESEKESELIVETEMNISTEKLAEIKQLKAYDYLKFSPDGSGILAYVVSSGTGEDHKDFMVFNGEKQKEYDYVGRPIVSPDSKRIAYEAKEGFKYGEKQELLNMGMTFVVVDREEGEEYYGVGDLFFSPDSERFAYIGFRGGKEYMIVDGQESKAYDRIGQKSKTYNYINVLNHDTFFSLNNERFAYIASRDGKQFMLVDYQESKPYDEVEYFSFSADSQRFAYKATLGEGQWMIVSEDKKNLISTQEQFIVADYKEGKKYGYVSEPIFSPDSKNFVYIARGKEISSELLFEEFIVVNNKEGKRYEYIFDPVFSSDGKYICYGAVVKGENGNKEIWWIADKLEDFK